MVDRFQEWTQQIYGMIPDDLIGLAHRLDRAESFVSVENISNQLYCTK
jgi:hypothetical protein